MTRSGDSTVAAHYSTGGLQGRIDRAMAEATLTPESVTIDDLGPVDEFHVGGRLATKRVTAGLGFGASSHVLDLGSGIGGTARFLHTEYGCSVTGVDLTADYVQVATTLTAWTCPDAAINFLHASALDTGLAAESFDGATQLHVGMNIADKPALFAEVFRLLRPGSQFVVYDLMGETESELTFPLPWASDPTTSFVATPDQYATAIGSAGFSIESTTDRTQDGLDAFAAQAASSPTPLGLHLVLGEHAKVKVGNLVHAIRNDLIAPTEIRCTKPA